MFQICVADKGSGIAKEHLNRVFEPFFTTKIGSGGTGLGLASSLGIVTRNGGTLTVDSSPGEGANFYTTFPTSE